MELRNLRAFLEVARCGGFSAAARALHSTQSTVSKAVLQLEHDCGIALLERLGRGIRLTEAGEIVVRRAANMVQEQEYLLSEISELRGLERGTLRLGMPSLVGGLIFADLFATYRKRYPGVVVDLHERAGRVCEEELHSGEIEIGFSLLPVPSEFEWRLVQDNEVLVILPKDHPLVSRSSLKLTDVADSPVVLLQEGFALTSIIIAAYRRRRLPLVEAGRAVNPEFIFAMVAAGLGIAFLSRPLVDCRTHRGVKAVVLDEPELRSRVAAIWRRGRLLSPPAQRWLEMVVPNANINSKRE